MMTGTFIDRRITMSMFQYVAKSAAAGTVLILLATSISMAQNAGPGQTAMPTDPSKRNAAMKASSSPAHAQKRSALARMTTPTTTNKNEHHLILQVNTNDSAAMNLALNNAINVTQYYKELSEKIKIEVITFGPGLHMLRNDTSPVKARIEEMSLSTPEVSFKACGNTQEKMQKAENKDIPIVPQAQVVKSGVVRVMELQEQGWTYVKP
jgi:intracellular sulfur oxidation DsrE/DsrF family protein